MKIGTEHLKRMGIPETHWGAKLSSIPDRCGHKAIVRDYIDNISKNIRTPRGLLFFGEFSQGKSALAAICLKAAATKEYLGYWIVAREIPTHQIEKTPFDAVQTVYDRATTVPILVIDELLIRAEIKGIEQYVEALVRHRVDRKLCTIITSNYAPKVISERFPALEAALREAVVPVKVFGHDFRSEIAKALSQR